MTGKTSEEGRRMVADTTALFNASDFPAHFEIIVPPGVVEELRRWGMSRRLELLLASRIEVRSPSDVSIERAREASQATGDAGRLSETDMSVLALTIELDIPVITDDYSIQNVIKSLGGDFLTMEKIGIREVFSWEFRCSGCGKQFKEHHDECDVCGHRLRPWRTGKGRTRDQNR